MPVIATWTPNDAVLDVVVPLGLAVAVGTALVIDVDPDGPRSAHGSTLAQLVADGPTRVDLEPQQSGPAYLPNGGVEIAEASSVIAALVARWPAAVLRCPPRQPRPDGALAVVPLLPEPWGTHHRGRTLYQRTVLSPSTAPDGVVLPRPRRSTVAALLAGRRPPIRDRWIRALRAVWEAM